MVDFNRYRYLCDNYKFNIYEIKDNVVYATGSVGSHITKEIIPQGIDFLKEFTIFKGMKLTGLNGADVYVTSETPYEQIEELYQAAQDEANARHQAEHEEFLKTPEGKEWLKKEEERKMREKAEKAEHELFVFHSKEEAFEALSAIKPCDLTSNETKLEDAVNFCKEVMTVLIKCEDLRLDHKELETALTNLGACTIDNASKKFRTNARTIGDILTKKNNIEFPLSVFTQIIGTSDESYRYGFSRAVDGGKKGWIGEWLYTQNQPEPGQRGE